jgi:hypothetical protein
MYHLKSKDLPKEKEKKKKKKTSTDGQDIIMVVTNNTFPRP